MYVCMFVNRLCYAMLFYAMRCDYAILCYYALQCNANAM